MKNIHKSNVRVKNSAFSTDFDMVQFDTGNVLELTIKDMTIPEGTTAKAFFLKPSGKFVYKESGVTINGNLVVCPVDNQAIAEVGLTKYQVKLYNGEDIISTFGGSLHVKSSYQDSSAEKSDTIITAFEQAVIDGEERIEAAKNAAVEEVGKVIDPTLTQKDKAADAKATGDALQGLESRLSESITDFMNSTNDNLEEIGVFENVLCESDTETQYIIKNDGVTLGSYGWKKSFKVKPYNTIFITGRHYETNYPLYLYYKDGEFVGYGKDTDSATKIYVDLEEIVPSGVDTIVINGDNIENIKLRVKKIKKSATHDDLESFKTMTEQTMDELSKNAIDTKREVKKAFDISNEKLKSVYVDGFSARDSFVDENHPYTRIGKNVVPQIVAGVGAYDITGSGLTCYCKDFDAFPLILSVSRARPTNPMRLSLSFYSDNAVNRNRIDIKPDGSVELTDVAKGMLFDMSDYYLFYVDKDNLTIYDDMGNHINIEIDYDSSYSLKYGINFGHKSYVGIGSLTQWEESPLYTFDIDKLIRRNSDFIHYHSDAGRDTTPELARIAFEQPDTHTNNVGYSFTVVNGENYRSEVRLREQDVNILGECERFYFSADYFVPSADNQVSGASDYIFQIHNHLYSVEGYHDAPPLHIHIGSGKLYTEVCYQLDGEIPTDDAKTVRDRYPLGDCIYDEWFNIEVIIHSGWKTGMMPLFIVKINGVEKVRCTTINAFNIFSSGANQILKFGCYTPIWGSESGRLQYPAPRRKIYISNIKYSH